MNTIPSDLVLPFLKGDGEMVERTRTFDWSKTSIGTPEKWPQSLRSVVANLLHSGFPMFLFWGQELLCFYNDAFRPSLGKEGKHPAIGKRGKEVWPEIWDFIGPLIEGVRTTGKPVWFEDQLVPFYRNGKLEDIYWTFSYSPAYSDDGSIRGVLVTCMDTTATVLAKKKLEESYEQFRLAIEATELGTWDFDPATNTLTGNERFNEWFGVPGDRGVAMQTGLAAVSEADQKRIDDAIQRALQYESGGHYNVEYKVIQPQTGEERYIRAQGRSWFGEDKQCYRFAGTLQDVTAQVLAQQKLQESEARFQKLVSQAPLGICVIDAATLAIENLNERFIQIAGKPREAILGQHYWDAFAEAAPDYVAALQGVIDNGGTFYANEVELMLVRYGQSEMIYVTFVYDPITDAKGKTQKVAIWVIENTHQVKARKKIQESEAELQQRVAERTQELAAAVRELQRSNAHLEEFAYAASHDLKEPIRKVHFFTNQLKSQLSTKLSPENERMFSRVEHASQRMNSLIDDLLLYSHVSQKPHEKESIDLNAKMKRILEDLELDIEESGAVITVDLLPVVQGYARQLQQLFHNLLTNALKYGKAGVAPLINISATVVNGDEAGLKTYTRYHLITVSDNGIGFEQEQAERIFQMFQRLHGKHEYEGTGVGLSIARKVAENHSGKITAEGKTGQGATFKLYLPVE